MNKETPPSLGYASWQIAKALHTRETNTDPKTQANAERKIRQWQQVIESLWSEDYTLGSRTPLKNTPNWVTLEVVTGGFATGNLLAGGELTDFEHELLLKLKANCDSNDPNQVRLWLNSYFISDAGLAELQQRLKNQHYTTHLPEESALMMVAWLLQHGTHDKRKLAEQILDSIMPFFATLRFYPIFTEQPNPPATTVHLEPVGKTLQRLNAIERNERVATQKTQIDIWLPFYDRVVALFLDTDILTNDALSVFSTQWLSRAAELYSELQTLKKQHPPRGKFAKNGSHQSTLMEMLHICAHAQHTDISVAQIKRIQHILSCYINKRGKPNSQQCRDFRSLQQHSASAPLYKDIAQVVSGRLRNLPMQKGVDNITPILQPITTQEATTAVPEQSTLPNTILTKLMRCENQPLQTLVETKRISSSEQLASVLPQVTANIKGIAIADSALRQLFSLTYQAFRKRRSLLLLNLEKQVQFEELPWVAAINNLRSDRQASKTASHEALSQVTQLTLTHFPHSILPNTLLQEMNALAKSSGVTLPLVEELAVDIFMGEFSPKFTHATIKASQVMQNTLYARYYDIDYMAFAMAHSEHKQPEKTKKSFSNMFIPNNKKEVRNNTLAKLCAKRAGQTLGKWDTTANGMIVEQQQILTTQNLAVVCSHLDLLNKLPLEDMAKRCFTWVCNRLQTNSPSWHAELISIKNSAYAWRQMLFYLSFVSHEQQGSFIEWATAHLASQHHEFIRRLQPALTGLSHIHMGLTFSDDALKNQNLQPFLGWTKDRHWLMK